MKKGIKAILSLGALTMMLSSNVMAIDPPDVEPPRCVAPIENRSDMEVDPPDVRPPRCIAPIENRSDMAVDPPDVRPPRG